MIVNAKKFSLGLALILALTSANVLFAASAPGVASADSAAVCDSSLWNHVYHSYRLVVHTQCMSVTGEVEDCYSEADGDYHIRIKVDTQYNYMLNSVNLSNEYGELVCEPICVAAITQSDAVAPCQGLVNTVYIPNVGEYVKVTGSYVTDNDHGWNELHPVTSIEIVSPTAINAVKQENLQIKSFPNPANESVNFTLNAFPGSPVQVILSDALGRSAGQYQMLNTLQLKVNVDWFPAGIYYYTIAQKQKVLTTGSFVVAH
jgi:hypothetical protein